MQLFRSCFILACSRLAAHTLYSQSIYSQPYTFTTLAGDAGHGSADGTGTNARFYYPAGVAVDSAGNVYVADYLNHTIRKITPAGVVSTLAGLAGSLAAPMARAPTRGSTYPRGVAVESAGNVYVADSDNHTIRFGRVAPAPPLLGISPSCGHLILSWPLEASNFLVEGSSTLSPGASWMGVTNVVGTNGSSFVATNSLEAGARFFRLRLP